MMNAKYEEEMRNMFDIINQIRESDYPEIPQEFIEEILMIERNNLGEREKAFTLLKSKISEYVSNLKME